MEEVVSLMGSRSALLPPWPGSAFAAAALAPGGGRHPVGGELRTFAEEELLHLLQEKLSRLGIGHAEAVMVHQDRGLAFPQLPALLGHVLEDALAERPR